MPQSRYLIQVVERLSHARTMESISGIVSEAARHLTGAEGATFVLRDNDKCYYADEDAISPLWKGKRFPIKACISGRSMLESKVITITDIYKDSRIPHDAYRPTFVKSLCMVPIRENAPIGAIGNYWSTEHTPTDEEIQFLKILANSCAIAIENLELKSELNHQMESFKFELHSLAHDLKSPLSTVIGLGELLEMRLDRALAKEHEYASSIRKVGTRLVRQIDRLLNLQKFSNKKAHRQKVNLSSMAAQIIEELKAIHTGRPVHAEIQDGLCTYADPELIRLVLENLISNAFKYSCKKDSTFIRFYQANGSSSPYVLEDHGEGFDPSKKDLLFKPFARLHSDSDFEGSGLGLASVAKIIELHGGNIWAESIPNEGAKFYFHLPELLLEAAQ